MRSAKDRERTIPPDQRPRGAFRLAWVGKSRSANACGVPYERLSEAIAAAPDVNEKRGAKGQKPCKVVLQFGPVPGGPNDASIQVVARYLLDGTKVFGVLPDEVVVLD
jgi:hypothetical protein